MLLFLLHQLLRALQQLRAGVSECIFQHHGVLLQSQHFPESEYTKRILEQQTLISGMETKHPVSFLAGYYDKEKFYEMARGLEHVREGGERCMLCYELRLRESAQIAAQADLTILQPP